MELEELVPLLQSKLDDYHSYVAMDEQGWQWVIQRESSRNIYAFYFRRLEQTYWELHAYARTDEQFLGGISNITKYAHEFKLVEGKLDLVSDRKSVLTFRRTH